MSQYDYDNLDFVNYADLKKNKNNNIQNPSIEKKTIKGPKKQNKNKKYKGKFPKKLAVTLLSVGVISSIFLNDPNLSREISMSLNSYSIEEQTMELNPNAKLDQAVLNAANTVLRNARLESYIDLENNYITNNENYSLDNYFMYEMVMGKDSEFENFSELAFAIPILNNKNIDKNSEIYKKAQKLLIDNADFLVGHTENISKEKLLSALEKVDTRELSDKKKEAFDDLYIAAVDGKVQVERSSKYSGDTKQLKDLLFYSKSNNHYSYPKYKRQCVAVEGLAAGRSFLDGEDSRRLIDGNSSITDAAVIRGNILLSSQVYNHKLEEYENFLKSELNKSDLSLKQKEKIQKKYDNYEKDLKEKYTSTLLKNANLISVVDNIEIESLDFKNGNIKESKKDKDKEEKNFENFVKNKKNKDYAITILSERSKEEIDLDKDDFEIELDDDFDRDY